MKRHLSLLLLVCILAALLPLSVSAGTIYKKPVSVVNGTRYTDYLVVYNKYYGATTGTNVYGFEVVVENSRVVSVGGNDNAIPQNGFVVSGHGTMKDWLMDYAEVGMKCTYTDAYVTFEIDEETDNYAAKIAFEDLTAAREKAIRGGYVIQSSAESQYKTLASEYSAGFSSDTARNTFISNALSLTDAYREKEVAEYRGVWIRPDQLNADAVYSYVLKCKNLGINLICVETMYDSTVIYTPKSGSLFERNPLFNYDCLQAYVDACHKCGIELHVWMPVFYSGNSGNAKYSRCPASKRPEWRNISQSGSVLYTGESSGMVFLNPALDEVQDFLAESYEYLIRNYDIDGFELDYIRYRDATATDDFGYDSTTINKFKEAYPQYKNEKITYDKKAIYWNDFVTFRQSLVTKFVKRMRDVVDSVNAETYASGKTKRTVVLSADVAADINTGKNTLYSTGTVWLENGYLDMIHPMAYGEGYEGVMHNFLDPAGDNALVVPGLGIYMENFGASDMVRQTKAMEDVGCAGVVYFQVAQYISKNCYPALKESVFSESTLAPRYDPWAAAEAILTRMSSRKCASDNKTDVNTVSLISSLVQSALADFEKDEDFASLCPSVIELQNLISAISDEYLAERYEKDLSVLRQVAFVESKGKFTSMLKEAGAIETENGKVLVYGRKEKAPKVSAITEKIVGAVLEKNGKAVEGDSAISTGMCLFAGNQKAYIALVGDISGDGYIKSNDYLLLKRRVLGTYKTDACAECASDISGDGSVKSNDYLLLKRHVLGTYKIDGE